VDTSFAGLRTGGVEEEKLAAPYLPASGAELLDDLLVPVFAMLHRT
jgi:hypothetical protein